MAPSEHAKLWGLRAEGGCVIAQTELGVWQGLTLVHLSAQLEPCLTQENTLHTLYTP